MPLNATDTENRIRQFYAGLAGGDGPAVVAAMAEDVVLELPRHDDNKVIPYMGTFHGLAGVGECGRIRDETTTTLHYEILDVVAAAGRACVTTFTRARQNRTGIVYEIEDIHHLTLDDAGKISRWKIYFDSIIEARAFTAGQPEQLIAAAWQGDLAAVNGLLDDGANPNVRDPESGLTALMIAAGTSHAAMVAVLLKAGADVYATDSEAGATALHKACQGGSLAVAKLLVEAGAFLNAPTSTTGHTPLIEAIWYKRPDITAYFVDLGAGLNMLTHYGFTLADHVAYALKANAVDQDLIEAIAASIDARHASDQARIEAAPLIAAAKAGDTKAVRDLLATGAAVDVRSPILNGFDDFHTPLLLAARENHGDVVSLLLAAGADPNAVEPTFGAVPLHKATYNGHPEITRLLAEAKGIDLDFAGSSNGYSPLHDALWHGWEDCARILVEAGARLDRRAHDGKTPLDIVRDVFGDDHSLTRLIVERGKAAPAR